MCMKKYYVCFSDGKIHEMSESIYVSTRDMCIDLDMLDFCLVRKEVSIMFLKFEEPEHFFFD